MESSESDDKSDSGESLNEDTSDEEIASQNSEHLGTVGSAGETVSKEKKDSNIAAEKCEAQGGHHKNSCSSKVSDKEKGGLTKSPAVHVAVNRLPDIQVSSQGKVSNFSVANIIISHIIVVLLILHSL